MSKILVIDIILRYSSFMTIHDYGEYVISEVAKFCFKIKFLITQQVSNHD